jgi:hypothetical protein
VDSIAWRASSGSGSASPPTPPTSGCVPLHHHVHPRRIHGLDPLDPHAVGRRSREPGERAAHLVLEAAVLVPASDQHGVGLGHRQHRDLGLERGSALGEPRLHRCQLAFVRGTVEPDANHLVDG